MRGGGGVLSWRARRITPEIIDGRHANPLQGLKCTSAQLHESPTLSFLELESRLHGMFPSARGPHGPVHPALALLHSRSGACFDVRGGRLTAVFSVYWVDFERWNVKVHVYDVFCGWRDAKKPDGEMWASILWRYVFHRYVNFALLNIF